MAQIIKMKRSSVAGRVPTTSQLEFGELAVNTTEGRLYLKYDDTTGTGLNSTDVVTQYAAYHNDAPFAGDVSVGGNFSVTGTANFAQGIIVPSGQETEVAGPLDAKEDVTLGTNSATSLTVKSTSYFEGDTTFQQNVQLDGDFNTAGNTTLGNTNTDILTVMATSIHQAAVTVNDNLTIGGTGNFNAQNNATLGSSASDALTVNATSTFQAPVDMNSALNVDGAFSTTGSTVLGNASADTLSVNATSTFQAPVTFNGGVTVQSGDTFTFDGLAFKDVHKFTIKNSAGSIVKGGWLLDTDATVAN